MANGVTLRCYLIADLDPQGDAYYCILLSPWVSLFRSETKQLDWNVQIN